MKLSSLLASLIVCYVVIASHPLLAQSSDDANKAKLEQRDRLWEQAIQVKDEGKLDEAAKLFEQVYALEESVFGPAHAELIETLEGLAQVAEEKQNNVGVIDIRKRRHRLTQQLYGEADYRTQDAKRAITEAEQNATRTPQQRASLLEASQAMATVNKLNGESQYTQAIPLAAKAAEIRKQILGEQHPDYATGLYWSAFLYDSMGDYSRAESLYVQAIETWKASLGEQHPDYATSRNSLARLCNAMGDYARAEPLFVQAMEIRKAALGEQHPDYATSLNDLAMLYQSMGDYTRAESLHVQTMEIRKAVLGEQHPDYATSLNNLAMLYQSMGDYARA